jgi:hypothetical protein
VVREPKFHAVPKISLGPAYVGRLAERTACGIPLPPPHQRENGGAFRPTCGRCTRRPEVVEYLLRARHDQFAIIRKVPNL